MALTTFCKINQQPLKFPACILKDTIFTKVEKTWLHSVQTKYFTTFPVRSSYGFLPATFVCKRNVLVCVSKVVAVDVSHHPFSAKFHTNDHLKTHFKLRHAEFRRQTSF